MLQTIYWLIAILVMILLFINACRTIKTDAEYRKYIRKQNMLIDKQMRDIFLRELKEVSEMLKVIKKEREDI